MWPITASSCLIGPCKACKFWFLKVRKAGKVYNIFAFISLICVTYFAKNSSDTLNVWGKSMFSRRLALTRQHYLYSWTFLVDPEPLYNFSSFILCSDQQKEPKIILMIGKRVLNPGRRVNSRSHMKLSIVDSSAQQLPLVVESVQQASHCCCCY